MIILRRGGGGRAWWVRDDGFEEGGEDGEGEVGY